MFIVAGAFSLAELSALPGAVPTAVSAVQAAAAGGLRL
jgi:hypothetical protein